MKVQKIVVGLILIVLSVVVYGIFKKSKNMKKILKENQEPIGI